MENPHNPEQLLKQLEWLDNERRNDKTVIAALQSKLEAFSIENSDLRTRLNELESEVTRLNTLMARLEQFEHDIASIRTETGQQIEDFKGSIQEKQIQTNRNQQEIITANQDIINIRKKIQTIEEMNIQKSLESQREESYRLARLNEELKAQIAEISHSDEGDKRSLRMIEESQRQDAKRVTDIQGEVASLRKRNDETRAKQDLVGDMLRKLETRFKGLLDAESDRRESQTSFIEKMSVSQVEQGRTFKQWGERFEKMEQFAAGLEENIKELEDTHRSVKKSQTALDEVTQRFERRVNEITEIQRLNEDRFRQEWTTFKSDDQKRWSNYVISQDEQHREMNQALDNLAEKVTNLHEQVEAIQDQVQQIGKADLKHMQMLLSAFRDSLDTYNTIVKE